MATILHLAQTGDLVKVDPMLGEDELEERCIYLHARVAAYLPDRLMTMTSELEIEMSPTEQLDDFVYHFTTGGALDYPRQFHEMQHRQDGIWELKTPDLRLFGWFADVDCFICTDIANATDVKHGPAAAENFGGTLYNGFCGMAAARRNLLDLDEPKYLTGEDPEDVVSNCYRS